MANLEFDQTTWTADRVLAALKEARAKLQVVEAEKHERVAIIGMAGRFPGAETVEQFWQNLCNGVNAIEVQPQDTAQPNYVNAYASFKDIAGFDAAFFGYSPREAELLDPQHRVFLECAWAALENAGYVPDRYEGAIGVYAGAALNSYLINLYVNPHLRQSVDRVQAVVSNVMGLMPTRVSYKLNLRGPSCGIQTGCSTSLVAVHLAIQSLLNRECDLALAGGVAIDTANTTGYLYQDDGVMSPDGYCRAFDAAAKGTVFGNGVGLVVLKRWSQAVADRDYIYAVIQGSAINNDGAQKVGLTAPSVAGQAAVITAALAKAAVDPSTIQYVETHGTGTALGDPIEIAALTKAFQQHTSQQQFCAIGSVKTNIGHLDAAAGITGLIKTALALKHQKIPPSLHFQTPNPQIDFIHSPFYVNTELKDWNNSLLRAAVSSFGMGGTNAHLILESASLSPTSPARPDQLLLLSAKTSTALSSATAQLATHLECHTDLDLADVAYTLKIGRTSLEHRRAVVCSSVTEAVQKLTLSNSHPSSSQVTSSITPIVVFLFPGQGSQYPGMGYDLYRSEPIFRNALDHCCDLLQPHLNLDLRTILYPASLATSLNSVSLGASSKPTLSQSPLTQTAFAQPALFALEYALAQLWCSWGIQPAALIGHSIGEYVAACLAGVFSLEDALKLVAVRGRLMQACAAGAMLSVRLSEAEVRQFLSPDLALAAVNAPQLCVISGTHEAVSDLEQRLAQQDITSRRLETSHAFHSPAMQPIVETFVAQVQQVSLQPPKQPLISNLTGTWITPKQALDPQYWGQQLCQPVQFAAGLNAILQKHEQSNRQDSGQENEQNNLSNHLVFLEVGAGRTLSTFAKQMSSASSFPSLPHPQESVADTTFLLNTLGQLWLNGVEIDWAGFYAAEQRQRVPLPTYPFERQRYWVDLPSSENATLESIAKTATAPLGKQESMQDWFSVLSWQRLPLPSPTPDVTTAPEPHTWLIFRDSLGVGEALAQKLRQNHQTVVTVDQGKQFSRRDTSSSHPSHIHPFNTYPSHIHYDLNPIQPSDYLALLQDLQQQNLSPQGIIHLWSLSSTPNADTPDAEILQNSYPELSSLIFLTQALSQAEPTQVVVVTQAIHSITGEETIHPWQSLTLGACKVIPQEYPHLNCINVDLNINVNSSSQFSNQTELYAEHLYQEVTVRSSNLSSHVSDHALNPTVIAYRHHHRWVQTFIPIPIAAPSQPMLLRQGGVYLIAGDLVEGLGLILAQSLAQLGATLILIGRPGLPDRANWETWQATHGAHDPISRCLCVLQGLESTGSKLYFFSADLADKAYLHSILDQVCCQLDSAEKPIHGVIHAGTMGDRSSCLIQDLTPAAIVAQLRTKVEGLLALEQVLGNRVQDFYLLQSSLSTVVGGVGFAAYAAANSFMDTCAQQHTELPWISVNWDACRWDESSDAPTGQALIDLALTPSEVWQVTQRVLSRPELSQVIVSPVDLSTRRQQAVQSTAPTLTTYTRPDLSIAYVAPRTDVERTIAATMAELLGIERLGIYDNFFELGGHSLLAIQAVSRLRETFQVELPMRDFLFESPTVAGIARVITQGQIQNTDQQSVINLLEQVEQMDVDAVHAMLDTDINTDTIQT